MRQAQVRELCLTLQREGNEPQSYTGTAWFVTDAPSDARLYEAAVSVRLHVPYNTRDGAFTPDGHRDDIVSNVLISKSIIGVDEESIERCVKNVLNAQYAARMEGVCATPEHKTY